MATLNFILTIILFVLFVILLVLHTLRNREFDKALDRAIQQIHTLDLDTAARFESNEAQLDDHQKCVAHLLKKESYRELIDLVDKEEHEG